MLLGDAKHFVGDLRFKTTVAAAPQILLPPGYLTETGAAQKNWPNENATSNLSYTAVFILL